MTRLLRALFLVGSLATSGPLRASCPDPDGFEATEALSATQPGTGGIGGTGQRAATPGTGGIGGTGALARQDRRERAWKPTAGSPAVDSLVVIAGRVTRRGTLCIAGQALQDDPDPSAGARPSLSDADRLTHAQFAAVFARRTATGFRLQGIAGVGPRELGAASALGALGRDSADAIIEGTLKRNGAEWHAADLTLIFTPETRFLGGSVDDLAPERRIRLHGRLDALGPLRVDRAEFAAPRPIPARTSP